MTVLLTWSEGNADEVGHRVYRDTATMDPAALPAPLADLGANVTEYQDASVADGTTYYYRVSAYTSTEEVVSAETTVTTPTNVVTLDFETDTWQQYMTGDWATADGSTTTTQPYEGTRHLRSLAITHNETSSAHLDLSSFAGTVNVSVYNAVNSESSYDFLRAYHNGTRILNRSGSGAWQELTFAAEPADTIEFRYEKDGSVSSGDDAGFIDLITLTPA